jgi:ribonuclease BN (tRNA processing enzyme)
MRVTVWGTRGSQPTPGPETVRYGGNTSCLEVRDDAGHLLVIDAGTGIRRLGVAVEADIKRVDVLLSHLHMDHIQGLGFFDCLYRPGLDVHVWGPPSFTLHLWSRLSRYLSPPLFPVRLRDLPCVLTLHDVPAGGIDVPGFTVEAALVCHPGQTVGYRIGADGVTLTYLSDHEPALGVDDFPREPRWTSGFDLAKGADLLVHDAQYADDEYADHVGWGHSSISHMTTFAQFVGARRVMPFHYDPGHDDDRRDELHDQAAARLPSDLALIPACEGDTVDVQSGAAVAEHTRLSRLL